MRKSTHLGVVAAALTIATGLAACGSSGGKTSSDGDFTISAANYTESAALFRVIHTNLDKVIESKKTGVAVKWYDNAGDPAKMTQNARLMVQDKPDAIVMYPVSNTTQGIGKIIGDSKIPCVSVNLATPNCAFLNIDNRELGIGSAKIVGAEAKKRGWNASNTTVLIGQNAASGEQVNDCVRYFHSTIAPILGLPTVEATSITPNMTKVSANAIQFDGGSQLQPSFKAVKNLLPSIPKDHNIILYAVSNDSTVGALRALQDGGRAGNDKLLIAGLGGDEQGIKALREDPRWVAEGDIFVSWWGQYAVAMAQALAKGVKPPAEVTLLPQAVLGKDTVDTYHKPGSVDVKQLPPLVESNSYLKDGGFLQVVGNIEGVK